MPQAPAAEFLPLFAEIPPTLCCARRRVDCEALTAPHPRFIVFDRFELGSGTAELVRHVWVVRWNIAPGEVRPQRVLSYPAFNAVIEPGHARLFGPDPRLDVQELRGQAWAVGVLFRPCALSG